MKTADVVVVGLGAMGSAALWNLTKRGVSVIGIDRFTPPHSNGSSHGDSRITRQAIGEGTAYVPLVLRSHHLWRELEDLAGVEIFNECGFLLISSADRAGRDGFFATTVRGARSNRIAHEVLDPVDARERFPQFAIHEADQVYFEPGGGFVRPERAITSQLNSGCNSGAEVSFDEQVLSVEEQASGVIVTTDKERYSAAKVIVSAGAWVGDFVMNAGFAHAFEVSRQTLHWFEISDSAGLHGPQNMPTYIWETGTKRDDFFYGFPAIDGPAGGLKVATEQHNATTTPDQLIRDVARSESLTMFDRFIEGRISAAKPSVVRSAACLYTSTPDEDFVLDYLPGSDRTIIASPCSGHGFKHSAAIGESLAQLATEGSTDIDLTAFSFSRFRSVGG
jgi:sarcosine oxidase